MADITFWNLGNVFKEKLGKDKTREISSWSTEDRNDKWAGRGIDREAVEIRVNHIARICGDEITSKKLPNLIHCPDRARGKHLENGIA
jgi:hypothetical protein